MYDIQLRAISQEVLINLIRDMSLKTTTLELLPHLIGNDKLEQICFIMFLWLLMILNSAS